MLPNRCRCCCRCWREGGRGEGGGRGPPGSAAAGGAGDFCGSAEDGVRASWRSDFMAVLVRTSAGEVT